MEQKGTAGKDSLWRKFKRSSYVELLGIICLIITYGIIVQSQNPAFLSSANITNVLKQIVVYGILSCALSFPMINGTFDLSVGAIAGIGGVICARFVTDGFYGIQLPIGWAIFFTILICSVFGVINGALVAMTKIPSFIVTIGSSIAIRGGLYIFSNNTSVNGLPKSLTGISNAEIIGLPLPTVIMFLIFICAWIVMTRTSYGRKIYAIGGSYQAAYISGINIKAIRLSTYIISAALSAVAGILMTARVGAATPSAGDGYETIAIAACAMGGLSLDGGSGTTIGVFLGAAMMGMITNGMNLMHLGSNWQMIVRGSIMVGAVFYSMWISDFVVGKSK